MRSSFVYFISALAAISLTSQAQYSIPTPSGSTLGRMDSAALSEIASFTNSVSTATWNGLQADVSMSYPGNTEPSSGQLTLWPGNHALLDLSGKNGHDLTEIRGFHGSIQYAGENKHPLSRAVATSGLVGFDLPFVIPSLQGKCSLIDRGAFQVSNGISLHRISLEFPTSPKPSSTEREVIDLYFDPSTHQLIRTVSSIDIPGVLGHKFLRIVTFTNYQEMGSLLIPLSISETLDGRTTWTLKVNDIISNHPAAN